MKRFKIAHFREQGVDIIVVPLDPSFGAKPQSQQQDTIDWLQSCAESAGLAGTVVPVWRSGRGHQFIAPTAWHKFFQSFTWDLIELSINKELSCG